MRADDGQVCHAYLTVAHYRHAFCFVPVTGGKIPHVGTEAAVNFTDYGIYARELYFEKVLTPAFKRFGEYGVVCV